jgi:hypothetical protein
MVRVRTRQKPPKPNIKDNKSFLDRAAFASRAFSTGTAWCVEGNLGAALWLPPGVKPDADAIASILDESVARDVESVARDAMADVNTMFAEMTAYHPHNPHWYLPTIGVEPCAFS